MTPDADDTADLPSKAHTDDDGPQLPDLSALGLDASGGMPDLGALMDGLARMQEMQSAVYEGSAGGGLVRIRANGRIDVESVVDQPRRPRATAPTPTCSPTSSTPRSTTSRPQIADRPAAGHGPARRPRSAG